MTCSFLNVWLSTWGEFPIPDELYKKTKWIKKRTTEHFCEDRKYIYVQEPDAVPENWPFFKWLHDMEVESGKPDEVTHEYA